MGKINEFVEWIIAPLFPDSEIKSTIKGEETEQKEEELDLYKLSEEDFIKKYFISDTKEEVKQEDVIDDEKQVQSFRPLTFKEYIGQEKAKKILKQYIKAIKERKKVFPHTLISGKAGMGKTTLAKIIAKELKVKMKETITSEIKETEEVLGLINAIDGGILFLDEIHSMDRNSAESLYPIMEDFKHKGKNIKPFTLIGATTEIGEIIKTRKPFYDRFKIIIELEDYSKEDIVKIGSGYKKKVFPEDKLSRKIYLVLSENSRHTPRKMIRFVEATIYFDGDFIEVLKNFNIIYKGYTKDDLKVLTYINQNKSGVGLNGISSYLGTSNENYLYMIEPYLLQNNLIIRTPKGRKISEEGIKKIKQLEKQLLKQRKEVICNS